MASVDCSTRENRRTCDWREVCVSGETFGARLHVEWCGCDTAEGWRVVAARPGHQVGLAVSSVVTVGRYEKSLQ